MAHSHVILVLFEVNAHSHGLAWCTIPSFHILHDLQHRIVPTCPRNHWVVIALPVKVLILELWVSHPHDVMQTR